MMRLPSVLIVILVVAVLQGQAYAQELRAKTEDGRQVVLKSDGTWKFVEAKNCSGGGRRVSEIGKGEGCL